MPIVSGIARWASVQQPNRTYEPEWTIELLMNKEDAKKVTEVAKANHPEAKRFPKPKLIDEGEYEGLYSIRFRRKVKRKDGSDNEAPRVLNAAKEPISDLIGNGSKVNILYRTYLWEFKGVSGAGLDLAGVQVIELVPFVSNSRDEEDFEVVSETKVDRDLPFDDDISF